MISGNPHFPYVTTQPLPHTPVIVVTNVREFAGVAENAGVGPVEYVEADAHGQGGALLVAGTVLTLAEGTAGIEPAGRAERATAAAATAKPEREGQVRARDTADRKRVSARESGAATRW